MFILATVELGASLSFKKVSDVAAGRHGPLCIFGYCVSNESDEDRRADDEYLAEVKEDNAKRAAKGLEPNGLAPNGPKPVDVWKNGQNAQDNAVSESNEEQAQFAVPTVPPEVAPATTQPYGGSAYANGPTTKHFYDYGEGTHLEDIISAEAQGNRGGIITDDPMGIITDYIGRIYFGMPDSLPKKGKPPNEGPQVASPPSAPITNAAKAAPRSGQRYPTPEQVEARKDAMQTAMTDPAKGWADYMGTFFK